MGLNVCSSKIKAPHECSSNINPETSAIKEKQGTFVTARNFSTAVDNTFTSGRFEVLVTCSVVFSQCGISNFLKVNDLNTTVFLNPGN